MPSLQPRPWVSEHCETFNHNIAQQTSTKTSAKTLAKIDELALKNRQIHEQDCFNLNPATNVMNPRAENLLASGIGSRPSLGYPGDKYEMGLEAIEEIEVICAELCAEVFEADFAEIRVGSGALGNLYAFMAICKAGDNIIVPPATIGGHVTHHNDGAAGLYGLNIHHAPVDEGGYSVDLEKLRALALKLKPTLITIGGSLNLFPHPVKGVRAIADEVGAKVLFDAAHQCGIIAGKAWPNPLKQGAHIMTMSTYKSLGGPPSGLIVTCDADLAQKLDAIAYPGLTANFDAAKSVALAVTMLDWREHGKAYAQMMLSTAKIFAQTLDDLGVPVYAKAQGFTQSHQFAIKAAAYGGGQTASKHLRKAGFLACGIGLPIAPVEDDLNGLRIGTPELVRWGMHNENAPEIAALVTKALNSDKPETLAAETKQLRAKFSKLHFINE